MVKQSVSKRRKGLAEPSKHYSTSRLQLLIAASKDGSLPDEVTSHIASCPECMDSFLEASRQKTPSVPAQDAYGAESSEVETVVQFGLAVDTERPLGLECWSDLMIRRAATRPLGNSIHITLFNHMSECERCRELHGSYRNAYLDILGRWHTAFRRLWLSWVLNLLIRIRFVRFFLLSRELRRRCSM